jgi:ribosomal protein S18 acetylase RimI-like enzyme
MDKQQITFTKYNNSFNPELNTWQAKEQAEGRNGLDEFVVSKGSLLGDYLEFLDSEMDDVACDIAMIEDQVAGFVCYTSPADGHVHIEILGINPDMRGKGIAKSMLQSFKQEMAHADISKVTLEANKNNQSAINSFSKVAIKSATQPKENYIGFEL